MARAFRAPGVRLAEGRGFSRVAGEPCAPDRSVPLGRFHGTTGRELLGRMMRGAFVLGSFWLVLGCAATPPQAPVVVSDGRPVMGTVLEVTLVAPDEETGR